MTKVADKFSLQPENDVLYVEMSGSWSPDTTLEFVAEYKKQVSRYFAREWAYVLNIAELEMLMSDEFQVATFKSLHTWAYIKGMQAIALIVAESNRGHLLYQFEEMLKGAGQIDTKVCQHADEAAEWLAEKRFSTRVLMNSHKTA